MFGFQKTNLDLVDDGATGGKRDLSTDFCRLDIFRSFKMLDSSSVTLAKVYLCRSLHFVLL